MFSRFKKFLSSSKSNNLLAIIIAVLGVAGSFLSSSYVVSKNINELRSEINSVNKQQVTTNIGPPQGEFLGVRTQVEASETSTYDENMWEFAKQIEVDKDGYYCPKRPSFPSWFMWTKEKYKADSKLSLSFALLDKTDNEKNPTLYLSYGDKSSEQPDVFYRINLFDGDIRTIRLYDRKNDEVLNERARANIPLDKYLVFELSPIFPNQKSSMLLLNPVLYYQDKEEQDEFDPEKEFKVSLPIPAGENQGRGFQYGLGVSAGDCFKIISSNI